MLFWTLLMMTLCSISSLLLFLNRLHQIYQIRSTLGGGGKMMIQCKRMIFGSPFKWKMIIQYKRMILGNPSFWIKFFVCMYGVEKSLLESLHLTITFSPWRISKVWFLLIDDAERNKHFLMVGWLISIYQCYFQLSAVMVLLISGIQNPVVWII